MPEPSAANQYFLTRTSSILLNYLELETMNFGTHVGPYAATAFTLLTGAAGAALRANGPVTGGAAGGAGNAAQDDSDSSNVALISASVVGGFLVAGLLAKAACRWCRGTENQAPTFQAPPDDGLPSYNQIFAISNPDMDASAGSPPPPYRSLTLNELGRVDSLPELHEMASRSQRSDSLRTLNSLDGQPQDQETAV